jgi:hypothetical protein
MVVQAGCCIIAAINAVCFHVVQVTWFVSWCLPRTCNTILQRAVVLAGGVLLWWRAGMGQCKDVMAASASVLQASARGQRRAINMLIGAFCALAVCFDVSMLTALPSLYARHAASLR